MYLKDISIRYLIESISKVSALIRALNTRNKITTQKFKKIN